MSARRGPPQPRCRRRAPADGEQALDLHRRLPRQGGHADGGTGVAAGLAEHLHCEVGGAVHHPRVLGELGRRGDEAAEAHHPAHPVQVAAAGRAELRQDVDEAEPRSGLPFLHRHGGAELAGVSDAAVAQRYLPGHHHEAVLHGEGDVVGQRRRRLRQVYAEFAQPRFDASFSHGTSFRSGVPSRLSARALPGWGPPRYRLPRHRDTSDASRPLNGALAVWCRSAPQPTCPMSPVRKRRPMAAHAGAVRRGSVLPWDRRKGRVRTRAGRYGRCRGSRQHYG